MSQTQLWVLPPRTGAPASLSLVPLDNGDNEQDLFFLVTARTKWACAFNVLYWELPCTGCTDPLFPALMSHSLYVFIHIKNNNNACGSLKLCLACHGYSENITTPSFLPLLSHSLSNDVSLFWSRAKVPKSWRLRLGSRERTRSRNSLTSFFLETFISLLQNSWLSSNHFAYMLT